MMIEFVIYHHTNVLDIYRVALIHIQDELSSTIYLWLYIIIVYLPICLRKTKLPGRVGGAIVSNDLCAWRIGFSGFKFSEYGFIFNPRQDVACFDIYVPVRNVPSNGPKMTHLCESDNKNYEHSPKL